RRGGGPQSVAYGVVSREIGARLRCCDQVVRRNSVLGVRQANFMNLAAEAFVQPYPGFDLRLDFCFQAPDEIFLRDADSSPFDRLVETFDVFVDGRVRGCRIQMIKPRHDLERLRCLTHGLRQWADLVERRTERNQTVSRDSAIRRLHADDTAECGWSPN